tara:strand:+ start:105 stop:722 length:618 start_codon:yes stop_codon:yes gene_type:complete
MLKRLVLGFTVGFFAQCAMAIEEPNYAVIEASGAFELRTYKPMIVAETRVSGTMDKAGTAGFKVIAGYIFGDNTSNSNTSNKINMTAPVSMKLESEKINMTAPVSMQQQDGQWLVHFVMPQSYTLSTLPTPNNSAVILREVPAHNYAAIRFSGFTGPIKVDRKIAELMAWLKVKGITPISEPEMARYDAPWVLPFLRRNEIMVRY